MNALSGRMGSFLLCLICAPVDMWLKSAETPQWCSVGIASCPFFAVVNSWSWRKRTAGSVREMLIPEKLIAKYKHE